MKPGDLIFVEKTRLWLSNTKCFTHTGPLIVLEILPSDRDTLGGTIKLFSPKGVVHVYRSNLEIGRIKATGEL